MDHLKNLLLASALFIFACKSNPDRKLIPGWSTDLLGPLVKTEVTGSEILQLKDLSIFTFSTVYDFGYDNPGQPDSIPSISLPPITQNASLNATFVSLELQQGLFSFRISNTLDIDIKKGAVIMIAQNGVVLLSDTLRSDLPAHTGIYNSKEASLAGKTIYPQFNITVSQLATDGTHGQTLTPGDKKLVTDFTIRNVVFDVITLPPGNYSISDTSSFNLNGRVIKTAALSGEIDTYVKNKFDFTTDVQIYFMDGNYLRNDSLFTNHLVIAPSTPSDTESVYRQVVTPDKFPNISKCVFVNPVVKFYATQQVSIRRENLMDIQLVGNLKITVNE